MGLLLGKNNRPSLLCPIVPKGLPLLCSAYNRCGPSPVSLRRGTKRWQDGLSSINSSHPIRASHQNTAVLWRRVRVRNIHGCARLLCDSTRGRGEGGWIPSATSMNEEGRDQMKAFDESMCHVPQQRPRGKYNLTRSRQPSMQRAPARVRVAECHRGKSQSRPPAAAPRPRGSGQAPCCENSPAW